MLVKQLFRWRMLGDLLVSPNNANKFSKKYNFIFIQIDFTVKNMLYNMVFIFCQLQNSHYFAAETNLQLRAHRIIPIQ